MPLPPPAHRTCPICSRDFWPNVPNAKYCNVRCQKKAARAKAAVRARMVVEPEENHDERTVLQLQQPSFADLTVAVPTIVALAKITGDDRVIKVFGAFPDGVVGQAKIQAAFPVLVAKQFTEHDEWTIMAPGDGKGGSLRPVLRTDIPEPAPATAPFPTPMLEEPKFDPFPIDPAVLAAAAAAITVVKPKTSTESMRAALDKFVPRFKEIPKIPEHMVAASVADLLTTSEPPPELPKSADQIEKGLPANFLSK